MDWFTKCMSISYRDQPSPKSLRNSVIVPDRALKCMVIQSFNLSMKWQSIVSDFLKPSSAKFLVANITLSIFQIEELKFWWKNRVKHF